MNSIIASIEAHQIQTEGEGPLSKSDEEIRQIQIARERFYSALSSAETSDDELVTLAAETGDGFFSPPSHDVVAELKDRLARFPIQFTRAEPPSVASLLSTSFSRVSRFFQYELTNASFILATDCIYRPHASVQEWAQDNYLVVMSRYLLVDLPMLANIIAQFICEVSKPNDVSPWLDPNFPVTLLEGIEHSSNRWHLAYALCAAAEGERYRMAYTMSDDPRCEHIVQEIRAGAIDFLLAHEIAHVAFGHLRGFPDKPSEIFPFFHEFLEVARRIGGADGQRLVDNFTKRWPSYERELNADTMALLCTGGDGPTGAWDLRLIGAQLMISTISFLDRAKFLIAHGKDPGMLIGLDRYMLPGYVDLALPRPGHPWGKTRSHWITNEALFRLYSSYFSKRELRRKGRLISVVSDILTLSTACALEVVRYVNSTPGEFVVIPLPRNKLITQHFPLLREAPTEYKTIESDTSQFYFDLSDKVLHHETKYTFAAAAYRIAIKEDEGLR
jgi:hypothetical protein